MRGFNKVVLTTGLISLVIAVIMLVTTIFVFCFDAKKEAAKGLKWGWDQATSYFDTDK